LFENTNQALGEYAEAFSFVKQPLWKEKDKE
jgi:hypothetical protein